MLDEKSKTMARMVDAIALLPPVLPSVTEWFDRFQMPSRSGVFEAEHSNPGKLYRYFDGVGNWYYGADTPRGALAIFQSQGIIVPATRWRGLTERAE